MTNMNLTADTADFQKIGHVYPQEVNQAAAKIVIIGAGPVGMRCIEELNKRSDNFEITLFGNESYAPYNRVRLSALLARETDISDILIPFPANDGKSTVNYKKATTIQKIDSDKKTVTDENGEVYPYDSLVLATGSKPFIPPVKGSDLKGVYTFYNMKDTLNLLEKIPESKGTVIIGGGLLGLEAAYALQKTHSNITLIQAAPHLMNRQLDANNASNLQQRMEALGIEILIDTFAEELVGDETVAAIKTNDGNIIPCETVVFCSGVVPETGLAKSTGIEINRGIVINDNLETSIKDIYAVGDCSEHRGRVYGLVSPGFEQAATLADRLNGTDSNYNGSKLVSQLKIFGEPVNSMGNVCDLAEQDNVEPLFYQNKKTGSSRLAILKDNKLVAVCSTGSWSDTHKFQQAYRKSETVSTWQALLFRLTGTFWPFSSETDVKSWPEDTIVCHCNQVTCGQLNAAVNRGCKNTQEISAETKAGTVCGSCIPLINIIAGENNQKPAKGAIKLAVFGLLSFVLAFAFLLIPGYQPVSSVQVSSPEFIWTDKLYKQITGFTILGLLGFGLIMSAVKRFKLKKIGSFSGWRIVHTILGVTTLLILFLHTGAHTGENLNQLLLVFFLLGSASGAMLGMNFYKSNALPGSFFYMSKKFLNWLHIIIVWPLPALLMAHVFSVYYF